MHVLHHHAAADAAGTIDPRGRAIALSVLFAAGALLLIMAPVIGASGTLGLLALVAWYGGQAWPALLPGLTFGSAGAAVAWRVAAGRAALSGSRVSGATALSVAVAIAATLLTWHTAGAGRGGVCFAFAVLLDWALLGALIVRIRQQESAA
ncbi:hypothetical protein [Klebsiella quasipneumoniae]|uniref:hypothetical protein n=1 Tax=Klebsiella quasipneumoniae TaxID=1463165 RepID=UPI0024777B41|nr:hypothetical protein [Klebsiella quasipneumoniae]GLV18785.1 hypothetical protein KML001_37720 [Klebsiella quasipneumoniae subsp. similipneumoniae]HDT5163755.1 hypothetical protein [Klebsiella quasipneumoniae subsp. similipneumoniae]